MMGKKKYLSFTKTYEIVAHIDKAEATQKTGLALKEFTQLYGMSKIIITEE